MNAKLGRYYVYTHSYKLIPNVEDFEGFPEIVESLSTTCGVTYAGYDTLEHARQAANLIMDISGTESSWNPVTLMYIARIEEVLYDAKTLVETSLQAPDKNNDVLELP